MMAKSFQTSGKELTGGIRQNAAFVSSNHSTDGTNPIAYANWLTPLTGLLLFLFICFLPVSAVAQQTTVKGKVTDMSTGEAIPFANVVFSGTEIGTSTDFDGYYTLTSTQDHDSVTISYIGYVPASRSIQANTSQTIHVALKETTTTLREVVITAERGENPAYAILRKVVENKPKNDKRSLKAYEYENYSKVELDVGELGKALKVQPIIKNMQAALDSMPALMDEQGQKLLPIFLSETLSEVYYRTDPEYKKEKILKTRLKGVGVEDGGLMSQLLGASLQDYNFYQNWLDFLDKQLVSPISDSWKSYYDYELVDSLYIEDDFCYRIEAFPKRKQDLAFNGTLWITQKEYALKQIDVRLRESANLNFIDEIRVQQQLIRTSAQPWLPEKTRVMLTLRPFRLTDASLLMKYYASIENPVVNEARDQNFYRQALEVANDAQMYPEDFWIQNRHDSLSTAEIQVFSMLDTINADPAVRRSVGFIKALASGYIDLGSIDIGPYPLFFLYNQIEKSRFGFGVRTNKDFSQKLRIAGFGAYGTGDQRFKYNLTANYIFSHRRWTAAKLVIEREIEQVGLDPDLVRDNYFFYASSKWGNLTSPYFYQNQSLSLQTDLWKGVTPTFFFRHTGFDPLYPFAYVEQAENPASPVLHSFITSELGTELRLSYQENFVATNFRRISLNNGKWPVLNFRYVYGMKGVLDSDFEYHELSLKVFQRLRLGLLGNLSYTLEGGQILNPLPYPLLQVHLGNESFFYTNAAFNLMNYMEFVSDQYAALRLLHNFDGQVMNKIPGIRRLNLRLLLEANVLYGDLSAENQKLLNNSARENTPASELSTLSGQPYVEVGYGIENILRFIRIDFFHRLTYLDKPDVRRFGIKVSGQLAF